MEQARFEIVYFSSTSNHSNNWTMAHGVLVLLNVNNLNRLLAILEKQAPNYIALNTSRTTEL